MHNDLVDLGWTDEQWNRITSVVTEEAQKARVAAQMLPLVGPEDPSTVAVPYFALGVGTNPNTDPPSEAPKRLTVDSDPTLFLTTIAVNVPLRSHEVSDSELKAGLVMFRRAANYIARIEDALAFNGRPADTAPVGAKIPNQVFTVKGAGEAPGLLAKPQGAQTPLGNRIKQLLKPGTPTAGLQGEDIVTAIMKAIGQLDAAGQLAPYACALSQDLFAKVCTPTANLVLPRDRILPFLQGPLLRASAITNPFGVVVALSGNPVELVVASDISVRFLQTTLEPRWVFRVSERVALRIKEENAIAVLDLDWAEELKTIYLDAQMSQDEKKKAVKALRPDITKDDHDRFDAEVANAEAAAVQTLRPMRKPRPMRTPRPGRTPRLGRSGRPK